MGDEVWVECCRCGHLHMVKGRYASVSDDDLYTKPLWCEKCKDVTKHLLIGENREDYYLNGDTTLDSRYFIYNTK